jgi:hypothetical protein
VASARTRTLRRGFTAGRLIAGGVLVLIAALYVGPLQKELRLRSELATGRTRVAALELRHKRLVRAEAALHTPAEIIRVARGCGWIFPGEQAYVVKGLANRSCR